MITYTDDLRRLAWGTDAGFYRLVPKKVILSENEEEVRSILSDSSKNKIPVTFRAAGTSLSGQSISDSILLVAGKNWEGFSVSEDAGTITLQPGIVGARVNAILKPFGRRFGPDPASIGSCMVGGIVMNNASGMSCGTHANSDKTMISARMILADGTVLNTGDETSKAEFRKTHPEFLAAIEKLRKEVIQDQELTERIKYKYSIKNVTGLNLLPLVTFEDPFDIIAHLLVGSEGTLAFLSSVTMKITMAMPVRFQMKSMKFRPTALPIMIFGGSPMSVAVPPTVALARKSSATAATSASSEATSPVDANTALLLLSHADAAPSTSQFEPAVHPPPFAPPPHM